MRLAGKSAIITGGSQGIGAAIAKAYAAEGAHVVILNRREETANVTVAEIRSEGGMADRLACDISNPIDVEKAVNSAVEIAGGLDIIVNNAGVYTMSPPGSTEVSDIDLMLAVNVRAVFLTCSVGLPHLRARNGGKILNVGSIFGNDGFPGSAIYCATKAAVHMLTKTLALDLRPDNIQVNALAPGWIETPMNEDLRASDYDFMRRAEERFGAPDVWMKPDELTGTAVFLATSESDSITGATVFCDRGWSAY